MFEAPNSAMLTSLSKAETVTIPASETRDTITAIATGVT
jgi:hypothetical protein